MTSFMVANNSNYQTRRSACEMDQSMTKYADLLKNILNLQESNKKVLDHLDQKKINNNKLQQFKLPNRHQSVNKQKTRPVVLSKQKSFSGTKNIAKNSLANQRKLTPSQEINQDYNSKTPKVSKINTPEVLINTKPSNSNSNPNNNKNSELIYKRSKSAENLNLKCKPSNKSPILKKNSFHITSKSSNNTTDDHYDPIENLLNMNNESLEILSEKHFQAILQLLNSKLNIKTENRKTFLTKLINLAKTYQPHEDIKQENLAEKNAIEMEQKLESMKYEIDKLKQQIHKNSNLHNNDKQKNHSDVSSPKSNLNKLGSLPNLNAPIEIIHQDLNNNLNAIVSSYSEKLADMQKQIFELTKVKNLTTETNSHVLTSMKQSNMIESKSSKKADKQPPQQSSTTNNNMRSPTNSNEIGKVVRSETNNMKKLLATINHLNSELKESNEKCKVLEYLLDLKSKENEQYAHLFKEINENVSCLINELESNEKEALSQQNKFVASNNCLSTIDSISLNGDQSKTYSNLKENLVKFQKKLKIVKHTDEHLSNSNSPEINLAKYKNYKQSFHHNDQQMFTNNIYPQTPLVINHNNMENIAKNQHNLTYIKTNYESHGNFLNKNDCSIKVFEQIQGPNEINNCSATTSSDTLIDADSSFDSIFRQGNFRSRPKYFLKSQKTNEAREFNTNTNTNNNSDFMTNFLPLKNEDSRNEEQNLKSRTNNDNYDFLIEDVDQQLNEMDESDDDNERIVIAMDDLSISTMQSTNTTSQEEETNVNSIANLNMKDEDQFQEGLKMLDQKIFKVKKLLESMKNA